MSQNSYIKEIVEGQTFEELKKSLEGRVKELEEACRINAPKEYKQGLEKDINYLSKQLEKKAKEQVQLQDCPLKDEQKTKSKEENKIIIGDMQSELEYFQKRLATEPLESLESESKQDYPDKRLIDAMAEDETEKHEQYSDRKYWDKIIDPDELEKEEYQNKENSLQKKLRQLKTEFDQTGKIDQKRIIELGKEFEENKLEGRTYKELEEKYIKLDKDSKRASSKYG